MFTQALHKSGSISFYDDEDSQKKIKEVIFAGAFCINYKEDFHWSSKKTFLTYISLLAGGVKIEESTFRFPWYKGPLVAPIDRALETVVEEIVFEKKSPPPVPPKVEKKSVEAIPEESSAEGAVTKPLSPELTKKIDGLDSDSKTALLKDLHENVGLVESFEENCGLVEGWKGLNGAGNLIQTATKAITKTRLPNDFMNALKAFGKTEDDILEYFTKYHNDNGFRFLNEAEDLVTQFPTLTKGEAYSLWGYTTDNFFFELKE